MKKTIISILLIAVILLSVPGCAMPYAGTSSSSGDAEESEHGAGEIDTFDELLEAAKSEKGITLNELCRIAKPECDTVTLRSLGVENRRILRGFNPKINSTIYEKQTVVSVMVSYFSYGGRTYQILSMCEDGAPPFETPESYSLDALNSLDALTGNAKPIRYDINEPKVQNSKVVAIERTTTAYRQDFEVCAAQPAKSSGRAKLSLAEAVLLDSSEQLVFSDLILPEGMDFRCCIAPLNRETGEDYSYVGGTWNTVLGTCAKCDSQKYDKIIRKYTELGSPVIMLELGTAVDYKDPYVYEKRYGMGILLPDSALDYVINNLSDVVNPFDGEFIQGLLKQTGTDLPVLCVTEDLTQRYLLYREEEMLAAPCAMYCICAE